MPYRDTHGKSIRHGCTATASIDIARRAGEVWAVVREPTSVASWNPIVEFARMEGCHRILELATGDIVVERIDSRDDRHHVLTYTLLDGPIPHATHHGVIEIQPIDQRTSRVVYTVRSAPDGVPDLIAGTVELAVRGLAALLDYTVEAGRDRIFDPPVMPHHTDI